jgi:hypothetical protein
MPEKILRLRQAAKVNQSFFKQMLQFELKYQEKPIVRLDLISQHKTGTWQGAHCFPQPSFNPAVDKISDMNIEKTQSTLRQFVREWGELGKPERDQCYQPIIDELVRRLPVDETNRYTCTPILWITRYGYHEGV